MELMFANCFAVSKSNLVYVPRLGYKQKAS